jgi:group I intron endonuclease
MMKIVIGMIKTIQTFNKKYYVYWIHKSDDDILNDGYVGVTQNISKRFKEHVRNSNTNKHHNYKLMKYIKENSNILFDIVLVADRDYCLDIEKKLRPYKDIGLNINSGGSCPLTAREISDSFREKMREVRSGICNYKPTESHKKLLSDKFKNRKFSEETKNKIRQNLTGKCWSEDRKKTFSNKKIEVLTPLGLYESKSAVAKAYGISIKTVTKWIKDKRNGFKVK